MDFVIQNDTVVVFDLDDTLYKEVDFLRSAFREIADILKPATGTDILDEMIKLFEQDQDVFATIINKYHVHTKSKEDLLAIYQHHSPNIHLADYAAEKLEELTRNGIKLGLITDGRSSTQRNKLKSLEIEHYFQKIIISEEFGSSKPDLRNFQYIQDHLPGNDYVYIGDNIQKDFIGPNILGWHSICIRDDGTNIHPQHWNKLADKNQQPAFCLESLNELTVNPGIHRLGRIKV